MNISAGIIVTEYQTFNVVVSSSVIMLNFGVLYLLHSLEIKDAFGISLSFVLPFIGIIEVIMSIMMPADWHDNIWLILLFGLIAFQVLMVFAVNLNSKV